MESFKFVVNVAVFVLLALACRPAFGSEGNRAESWRAAFEKVGSDDEAAANLAVVAASGDEIDWGPRAEDGFDAQMPWLGLGRDLYGVLVEQTGDAVKAGDASRVADLLVAQIQLASDMGQYVLVDELVEMGMTAGISRSAADALAKLDLDAMERLDAALETTEKSLDLAAAIRGDRDLFVTALEDSDEFPFEMLNLGDNEAARVIFDDIWSDEDTKTAAINQLRTGFDDMIDAVEGLDFPKQSARLTEIDRAAKAGEYGELAGTVMPSMSRAHRAYGMAKTHRALLRAAVGQMLDGTEGRNAVLDPATNKPFALERVGRGFRLVSATNGNDGNDGKPIVIEVLP